MGAQEHTGAGFVDVLAGEAGGAVGVALGVEDHAGEGVEEGEVAGVFDACRKDGAAADGGGEFHDLFGGEGCGEQLADGAVCECFGEDGGGEEYGWEGHGEGGKGGVNAPAGTWYAALLRDGAVAVDAVLDGLRLFGGELGAAGSGREAGEFLQGLGVEAAGGLGAACARAATADADGDLGLGVGGLRGGVLSQFSSLCRPA